MGAPPSPKPEWSPRLWEGLDYFAFWRLLWRARFRVGRRQVYIVLIMSVVTLVNTILGWLQAASTRERLKRLPRPRPLFVLGHWRSGTTLLHELFLLDPRFTAPTTHDCFLPCHNFLSSEFVRRRLAFAMPAKRPMDNMPAGWERPQEDEFALALLGEPSTYTDIAFPWNPPLDPGALDLSGLSPRRVRRWQRTLDRFVRVLQLRDPRRVVLKSPPHTARILELLALYPDAQFVTVTRDPAELFASTVKLWHSLAAAHGLQDAPAPAHFEAKVWREFRVIMTRYLATRGRIPPGNLVEVGFAELTADMPGTMRRVYDALGLGGFEAARPAIEAYAARNRGYERNRLGVTPELRAEVEARWGDLAAEIERLAGPRSRVV